MSDKKRDNENHTFVVAVSVGKGLGKIKHVRRSWRKWMRLWSEPLRDTTCTFAQYEAMSQDEKLEKKRQPGSWTPSRYKGNRRAVVDLEEKTLLVYDLDYVTHDQLDHIRLGLAPISRFEWFMHTSRSHTPESPRVRMILPVSRPMKPDEANAVFRLVAQELADDPEEGIEIPDLVSFRSNQTMFLPSISKDQEFWTDRNVGDIVDVDAILAANPGWENYENLPYQQAEHKKGITDPNKRMEDPYQKPEPIGAWCRCYSVQEVIEEFLSDIYVPGDSETEERYTYLPGSGANGAVVYEGGKFLHSNHGTDPVDTANAFDLARIHLFGHLDAEAHHNTTPGNMPSFKAMVEFARKDERVLAELYGDHDATLDDLDDDEEVEKPSPPSKTKHDDLDLDDILGDEPESDDPLGDRLDDLDEGEDDDEKPAKKDPSWRQHLRTKAKGQIESSVWNSTLIARNDRRIKDCIAYNQFTYDPICLKPLRAPKIELPSRALTRAEKKRGRRWEEADDVSFDLICAANNDSGGYEVDFGQIDIQKAILAAGMLNPRHPVKAFLDEQHAKWQKNGRPTEDLDTWVIDYLGCPDTPFHRESARTLLIAAVARIMEPGCKFDVMPIIEGKTGSRKSTFWSILFGGFVKELDCDLDDTGRVIENLRGNWAVEMAEMAAAKKADSNMLKMRLSSARDVHRLAYAKREMEFPRQSIWVGTSNEDDYLTDPTSNRRFWVWRSTKDRFNPINTERLEKNLWRLWGAAYQAYLDLRAEKPYGDLWLDLQNHETILEASQIAEQSRKLTAVEIIAEGIREWLDTPTPASLAKQMDLDPAAADLDDLDDEGAEDMVIRNMVTAMEVYEAIRGMPFMGAYKSADARTVSKAMKLIPGWRDIGKVRRHDQHQATWFVRDQDGPRWIPAQTHEDDEVDDLLG